MNCARAARPLWLLAAITCLTLASAPAHAATPAFSVHKNGTSQTVTQDTDVKLTWSTEVFDTNNNFATDRFTPSVAGKYLIVVSAQCDQAGACMPSIYKNGALLARAASTNVNIGQTPHVTAIVDMNGTTDYVEAYINAASSSINGTAARTYFSGSQVDAAGSGGGSSQWTTSGSDIYYSTGNVGIGTASPTAKLQVVGDALIDSGAASSALSIGAFNDNSKKWSMLNGNGVLQIVGNGASATALTVAPSNSAKMTFSNGGVAIGNLYAASYATYPPPVDGLLVQGNVGLGTATPQAKLDVNGTTRFSGPATTEFEDWNGQNSNKWRLWNYDGTFYFSTLNTAWTFVSHGMYLDQSGNLTIGGNGFKPGGGAWTASSDARLKDIEGSYERGLESIVALQPIRYHYKKGNIRREPSDRAFVGLIAQDVQKVFPEAVSEGKDGYFSLDATPINFALINAIKDLNAENDNLRAELRKTINAQDAEIDVLRRQIEALKVGQ